MEQKNGNNFPKRGELFWVDLEPTRDGETQKIRPALIVSNDIGNQFSKIVMVAPITSKASCIYPTEVKTVIDGRDTKIMLHQCRAVDKSRLLKKIGTVDIEVLLESEKAIKVVFGLS